MLPKCRIRLMQLETELRVCDNELKRLRRRQTQLVQRINKVWWMGASEDEKREMRILEKIGESSGPTEE